jgi:hypothetical protein
MNTTTSIQGKIAKRSLLKRGLLSCGIASSVLYAAMLILVPMQWDDYSSASQTVSELSAIDAPTRALWVLPGMAYTLLMAIFGFGIQKSANGNRPLKIVGTIIIIYGLIGIFWPPMHLREVLAVNGPTLTDTLHIVWTIATVLLMLLAIGFGSMAFGKWFRVYSIVTILILFSFGILTGIDAPRVQANLPTPMAGIWERINIGVFLLWVSAFSLVLLREKNEASYKT